MDQPRRKSRGMLMPVQGGGAFHAGFLAGRQGGIGTVTSRPMLAPVTASYAVVGGGTGRDMHAAMHAR